jgi:hypothetical protein
VAAKPWSRGAQCLVSVQMRVVGALKAIQVVIIASDHIG